MLFEVVSATNSAVRSSRSTDLGFYLQHIQSPGIVRGFLFSGRVANFRDGSRLCENPVDAMIFLLNWRGK